MGMAALSVLFEGPVAEAAIEAVLRAAGLDGGGLAAGGYTVDGWRVEVVPVAAPLPLETAEEAARHSPWEQAREVAQRHAARLRVVAEHPAEGSPLPRLQAVTRV